MKVYIAAPLFSKAEQEFNLRIASILNQHSFSVILPQEECEGLGSRDIFNKCKEGINKADIIIAVLDGADADSGTCWEVGYAYSKNKLIIALRTDFRKSGDTGGFNAMLFHSANYVINELLDLPLILLQIKKGLN